MMLLLLFTGSIPTSAAQAGDADPAHELIGVWEARRIFGPSVRGMLTLIRRDHRWYAEIAGHTVRAREAEHRISFELPGRYGEFRGRIDTDGGGVIGHWIQPQTTLSGVSYASPVHLDLREPGHWRGTVNPLEDAMTVFLVVQEHEDGSVGAFVRNPERNVGIFLENGHMVRDGTEVQLVGNFRWEDEERVLAAGVFDAETERFSLNFLGATFEFARLPDDGTSDFYPRWERSSRYFYAPPIADDDGWSTATLEEVGIAREPVRQLIQKIIDTQTESVFSPYLHALLVARRGKLVLEEYFHGFHRERPHDTRSSSKSITSTLVGAAIDEGTPLDVTSSVYTIMSGDAPPEDLDPRKQAMTVEHLLTMNSGYDCDVNDPSSAGYEDTMQGQTEEPDWYRFTLELPMVRAPGEKAVYCSANANLLGGVLSQVTGQSWLPEYFHDHYARPLQIRRYHMNLMPTGQAYMGGGLYLRPRDFMKLGQVFLEGGTWNGHRVVSEAWVERATAPIVSLNDQQYGYLWWVISYPYRGETVRAFYSGGNGGQMVIVIPDLELVVTFLAGNYGHFASLVRFRDEYVTDILRAVETVD